MSPPVPKLRKIEQREASDQRMIETAMQLILSKGVSGLQLTDVGLKAGYSRGLATMRFGTMGGLLRRLASEMSRKWLDHLNQRVGQKTGMAAVYASVDTLEELLASRADHVRIQYLLFFHSIDPGGAHRLNVRQVLLAEQSDLIRWLGQALEAGELKDDVDPDQEASAILSSMIGIIYQTMVNPDASPKKMFGKLKRDIQSRIAR